MAVANKLCMIVPVKFGIVGDHIETLAAFTGTKICSMHLASCGVRTHAA